MHNINICITLHERTVPMLKLICAAWKYFFPASTLHISVITEKGARDKMFAPIYKYTQSITVAKPIPGCDNQRELLALWAPTQQWYKNELCVLCDPYTIPLSSNYLTNLISAYAAGNIYGAPDALERYTIFAADDWRKIVNNTNAPLDKFCASHTASVFESVNFIYDAKARQIESEQRINRAQWCIESNRLHTNGYVEALLPRNIDASHMMLWPLYDLLEVAV